MNEFFDALLNWVANGLADFSVWQLVIYTLVVTHITIASVTIFLHRAQAHRVLFEHQRAPRLLLRAV